MVAQVLRESEQRSKVQKLQDLVDHPTTNPHVREMAKRKIEELQSLYPDLYTQQPTASRFDPAIMTNIQEEDLPRPYYQGIFGQVKTIGDFYDAIRMIDPKPYSIEFRPNGQIGFKVKGPFEITKAEFANRINRAVPEAQSIYFAFRGDQGYAVQISLTRDSR